MLIVAPVRFYREGLADVLRSHGMQIMATAASADMAVAVLAERGGAVVVIDAATLPPAETTRAILTRSPESRVLVLGIPDGALDVVACVAAGAIGFVEREASVPELVNAVISLMRGDVVCPSSIAAILMRHVASASVTARVSADLTPRENEVVQLIAEGLSNKEISQRLGIETTTVKNHIHNILDKLGVSRRTEAAARVFSRN